MITHGIQGGFKCRLCEMMWSSFIQNDIPCINTSIRQGLRDFDFAYPIHIATKDVESSSFAKLVHLVSFVLFSISGLHDIIYLCQLQISSEYHLSSFQLYMKIHILVKME
jgi:hypothetical protein